MVPFQAACASFDWTSNCSNKVIFRVNEFSQFLDQVNTGQAVNIILQPQESVAAVDGSFCQETCSLTVPLNNSLTYTVLASTNSSDTTVPECLFNLRLRFFGEGDPGVSSSQPLHVYAVMLLQANDICRHMGSRYI